MGSFGVGDNPYTQPLRTLQNHVDNMIEINENLKELEKKMGTYGDITIVDAVTLFCRMIGVDEEFTVGWTVEPGRLVVCQMLRDPGNPSEALLDADGLPMVGDYTADFGAGTSLTFVEGSERPITDLITVEGDNQEGKN